MRLVTPPSVVPVTLAAAKARLRVDHAEDDELIGELIAAAVSYLDGWSGVVGRALEEQTWETALDRFPAKEIRLPLGPVASVVWVRYSDPDGVEQTVAADDYDATAVDGWIVPRIVWPATADMVNAVRFRWVAGTGCPGAVRQAILLLVGHWYAAREAQGAGQEIPFGVTTLIAPWRCVGI